MTYTGTWSPGRSGWHGLPYGRSFSAMLDLVQISFAFLNQMVSLEHTKGFTFLRK